MLALMFLLDLKLLNHKKNSTAWLFLTLYVSFLHINASFPHVWLPGNPAFIKKLCGQAAFQMLTLSYTNRGGRAG